MGASIKLSLAFLWLLSIRFAISARDDNLIETDHFQAHENRSVPFQVVEDSYLAADVRWELMQDKVIGAGLAKTGTTSLRHALEILGIQPVHDAQNLSGPNSRVDLWSQQIMLKKQGKYNTEDGIWDTAEQWDQVLGDYSAIVDLPAHMFFADLARAYPEAKVILTVRDSPEAWQDSYRATVYDRLRLRQRHISYQVRAFAQWLAGCESKKQIIHRASTYGDGWKIKEPQRWWYTQQFEHVRKHIPAERLLEFNVKEGWEPLCRFLGKDVPDVPFPHVKTRQQWLETSDRLQAEVVWEYKCAISIGVACLIAGAFLTIFRRK